MPDAGLKELARVKSLQTLHLAGSEATEAGLRELQKALPGLQDLTLGGSRFAMCSRGRGLDRGSSEGEVSTPVRRFRTRD